MYILIDKASLSTGQRLVVEAMQRLWFGRIENMQVRNGEPILHSDPPPRFIQDIRLGTGDGLPPQLENAPNFILKAQVIELFERLGRVGQGTVAAIEVRHGLPFRLVIDQPQDSSRPHRNGHA
jgi:hypothetical protein